MALQVQAAASPLSTKRAKSPSVTDTGEVAQTHAAQQNPRSLDHLVGTGQERRGDGEAEHLGGLKINRQFELGRLRYW